MYASLESADIYYEIIGSGTPLLMIHGNWCDHRLMKGCMEPLFDNPEGRKPRGEWQRIYFDLPGMGDTLVKSGITSTDDILSIVTAFIDRILPDKNFALASESYGSYIGIALTSKYPERILGHEMICPVIVPLHEERILPALHAVYRDNDFFDSLSLRDQETCSTMLTIQTEENWKRYLDEVKCGVKKCSIALLKKIKRHNYSLKENPDVPDKVFNKPSLVLLGRQDISVGYRDALSIIENYPRGDFVILDSAGHMLQIEQKELFEIHTAAWLDRIRRLEDINL